MARAKLNKFEHIQGSGAGTGRARELGPGGSLHGDDRIGGGGIGMAV